MASGGCHICLSIDQQQRTELESLRRGLSLHGRDMLYLCRNKVNIAKAPDEIWRVTLELRKLRPPQLLNLYVVTFCNSSLQQAIPMCIHFLLVFVIEFGICPPSCCARSTLHLPVESGGKWRFPGWNPPPFSIGYQLAGL